MQKNESSLFQNLEKNILSSNNNIPSHHCTLTSSVINPVFHHSKQYDAVKQWLCQSLYPIRKSNLLLLIGKSGCGKSFALHNNISTINKNNNNGVTIRYQLLEFEEIRDICKKKNLFCSPKIITLFHIQDIELFSGNQRLLFKLIQFIETCYLIKKACVFVIETSHQDAFYHLKIISNKPLGTYLKGKSWCQTVIYPDLTEIKPGLQFGLFYHPKKNKKKIRQHLYQQIESFGSIDFRQLKLQMEFLLFDQQQNNNNNGFQFSATTPPHIHFNMIDSLLNYFEMNYSSIPHGINNCFMFAENTLTDQKRPHYYSHSSLISARPIIGIESKQEALDSHYYQHFINNTTISSVPPLYSSSTSVSTTSVSTTSVSTYKMMECQSSLLDLMTDPLQMLFPDTTLFGIITAIKPFIDDPKKSAKLLFINNRHHNRFNNNNNGDIDDNRDENNNHNITTDIK